MSVDLFHVYMTSEIDLARRWIRLSTKGVCKKNRTCSVFKNVLTWFAQHFNIDQQLLLTCTVILGFTNQSQSDLPKMFRDKWIKQIWVCYCKHNYLIKFRSKQTRLKKNTSNLTKYVTSNTKEFTNTIFSNFSIKL